MYKINVVLILNWTRIFFKNFFFPMEYWIWQMRYISLLLQGLLFSQSKISSAGVLSELWVPTQQAGAVFWATNLCVWDFLCIENCLITLLLGTRPLSSSSSFDLQWFFFLYSWLSSSWPNFSTIIHAPILFCILVHNIIAQWAKIRKKNLLIFVGTILTILPLRLKSIFFLKFYFK